MADAGVPDVSIIIPTLDEEAHVEATIERALAQRFAGSLEVLVVDGGSRDRTVALVQEAAERDPRMRLLHNPHRLIPHALNIGLRAARGEVIVRMDAHTVYPPEYVSVGLARLRRGDVAWVAGPQLAEGVDPGSRRVALALGTRLGMGGAEFRRASREIETDAGFTGMLLRQTLLDLGGWDERWPINEDGELAARVRAEGGRIVCVPEMAARYLPRSTLGGLARQYLRYGQYRARTSLRHPASMRRSHLLPPAVACAVVLAPRGPLARPARTALSAWAVALVGTSAHAARTPRDLVGLPAVLATMHLAWGTGFLVGCARFARAGRSAG